MDHRIYLDHAATTPLDARVLEAMAPALSRAWGNPSSSYSEGREARRLLDGARRSVAANLGASPQEIIFTGGGSEADNLAICGIARAAGGRHIIISQIEHHAVLHAASALERDGYRVTHVPVNEQGFVDANALVDAVDDDTALVSIMYANNEVGTVEPVAELARRVKAKNPRAVFHTDAVQAAAELDCDVGRLGIDALSLTAHKLYGPKGVGALYLRRGTPLEPLIRGGAQERERRAGTENVAGAVGLATALRLAVEEREVRTQRIRAQRDRLLAELPRRVAGLYITGSRDGERRLANSVSCYLEGVDIELLLLQLDLAGIAASSGSACTTGSLEPSHVLLAMGIPPSLARGSLRLTLGKDNTAAEIDELLTVLPKLAERSAGTATATVGASARRAAS